MVLGQPRSPRRMRTPFLTDQESPRPKIATAIYGPSTVANQRCRNRPWSTRCQRWQFFNPNLQETDMYTQTAARRARCILGTVAVACALLTGTALADEHQVVVAIPVSGQGLNLNNPAGARELYRR